MSYLNKSVHASRAIKNKLQIRTRLYSLQNSVLKLHLTETDPGSIYLEVLQTGWINKRCSTNKSRKTKTISSFTWLLLLLAYARKVFQFILEVNIKPEKPTASLSLALKGAKYTVLCCYFHDTPEDVSDIWTWITDKSYTASYWLFARAWWPQTTFLIFTGWTGLGKSYYIGHRLLPK